MSALSKWNGGVILISHDERFITTVAQEVSFSLLEKRRKRLIGSFFQPIQLWICGDGTVTKFMGDVQAYKVSYLRQRNPIRFFNILLTFFVHCRA